MAIGGGSGGGKGARDVRAGGAFVEIFSRDTMLRKGLAAAEKRVAQTGKFFAEVGKKALAAGSIILAPLGALFLKAVDGAAQLDDLADAFSTTTEKLSPLAYAFKVAGLGLEDLEKAMREVAKNDKSGRPVEDVLAEWAIALNDIEDPAERVRKALDQFGKAGVNIAKIAPDLAKLMAGAPIVSSEDAKNAEKFQQEFAKIGLTLQAAVMPAVGWFAMMAGKASAWAKANSGLVSTIAAVGAGLVAAGAAAWALGAAFSGVAAAIGVASKVFGVLGGTMAFLLTWPGLITLAIGTAAAAFLLLTKNGRDFTDKVGEGFKWFAGVAKESWGGIVAAIQKGDLELAAGIAFSTIKVAWLQLMSFMTEQWNGFKAHWVDGWEKITTRIAKGIAGDKSGVNTFLAGAGAGAIAGGAAGSIVPVVGTGFGALFGAILGGIGGGALHNELKGADRDAMVADLEGDLKRRLADRDAARRADQAAIRAQLDAEIAGLREKIDRARQPAAATPGAASDGSKIGAELLGLPDQVKGMFGAMNARAAFGFADENAKNRQLKALDNVANKVQQVEAAINEMSASVNQTLSQLGAVFT